MEVLIEILGEIFFEGIFELSQSKRIPKLLRCLILFTFGLIYSSIIFFLGVLSVKGIKNNNIAVAIFFGLCSMLLIIMLIAFFRKSKQKNTTN